MAGWTSLASDCSNESSFLLRGCGSNLPPMVSMWTLEYLDSVRIFYDGNASDLSLIISRMKERVARRSQTKLPDIGIKLVDTMTSFLSFSLDFNQSLFECDNDIFHVEKDKIYSVLENFRSQSFKLKSEFGQLLDDENCQRIYYKWSAAVLEFLNMINIFIVRWMSEEIVKENLIQLFMQFARVCLMIPESGACCRKSMKIMGKNVTSVPDVRFPLFSPTDASSTNHIVTFAEVKDNNRLRMEETAVDSFSIYNEKFSKKFHHTLAQHGAQLLVEAKNSYFKPAVSGMICFGTKVMFTLLEISRDHELLLRNDIDDDQRKADIKSTIIYSRPYDFMDAKDRNEILESFVWFGYVQSFAYKNI